MLSKPYINSDSRQECLDLLPVICDDPAILDFCLINLDLMYLNAEMVLHREGSSPAFIGSNGDIVFAIQGRLHCEDGPALDGNDQILYAVDGIVISFEEWLAVKNEM